MKHNGATYKRIESMVNIKLQANGLSSADGSRYPSSSAYLKRLRELQNKSENCSIVFSENKTD